MDIREQKRQELIGIIKRMGYPEELGVAIADNLRTEKMMHRMCRYLEMAHPRSEEEIVDEMLAIMSDRDRWTRKKESEYYNQKYNEYLNSRQYEEDD